MNTFKIAFANIKKRKGSAITFLVMVLISALMLSLSLALLLGMSDFYDKKIDELNAPHMSYFIHEESYKNEYTDFANNYDDKTDVYVMTGLFVAGDWTYESTKESTTVILFNEIELSGSGFYKPEIIDGLSSKPSDMIILPISFKSNGLRSGDKIKLELFSGNYTFTVYGFYEDPISGGSTSSTTIAFLSSEKYSELKSDEVSFSSWKWLMIRFVKAEDSRAFSADFNRNYTLMANEIISISYDMSKSTALTFPQMIAMLFVLFSLIILIIAFIVVNFSIKNSISEDISNIGALKSIGYKSRTLRRIQILQYLIIACLGAIVGSVIFLFTFGLLGNMIASTSGLLWIQSANIIPAIITIAIISILTLVIVFLATRRYKKITPVSALRQGESHHSFKRNPMPLEKHNMPLNFHLGTKRFFNSVKNSVTLCVVVALLTFVSLVTYIMSYNL
ncbi:MAG: ABC transporter permease, partial [Firmicutes bacterium]|nr:ABC transporter permease [Bacillota bacterium]